MSHCLFRELGTSQRVQYIEPRGPRGAAALDRSEHNMRALRHVRGQFDADRQI